MLPAVSDFRGGGRGPGSFGAELGADLDPYRGIGPFDAFFRPTPMSFFPIVFLPHRLRSRRDQSGEVSKTGRGALRYREV